MLTPGPWHQGDPNDYVFHLDPETGMGYRFRPIYNAGGCLAWVSADDGDAEAEPNARAIALVPEMIAALRAIAAETYYDGEEAHAFRCCCGAPYSYPNPYTGAEAPNPHDRDCRIARLLTRLDAKE